MNARRLGSVPALAALAILLVCGSAWAQATATISGTARGSKRRACCPG